ncbi:hypothetical protein BN946_scf184908.g112 [Trametes cinnabarina]|uniref:HIG1 domain-containing protein n=1 Tax=Pycnoporus cinnabarinus TaxID=5643 RepID=A0A060SGK5_PYCCI|nr:hypothetical protein BN946_scf184908.g112 [Trametes cinnabarina]
MKKQEELDAQQRATLIGGLKGFVGGLAFALPTSYFMHRKWPYYRALPPSLKALGIIIVAVPSFVISAEHASQRFEEQRWNDAGKAELDAVQARQRARWETMTTSQKVADFAKRHEYGIILTSWATALVGSFTYIMRDPYQSVPQKLVQARMWAQGLTIGILIAAGVLTHAQRARKYEEEEDHRFRHIEPDHSWRDILEQEEQERAQATDPNKRPS